MDANMDVVEQSVELFGRCYKAKHLKEVNVQTLFEPKHEPLLHNPYPKIICKDQRIPLTRNGPRDNFTVVVDNWSVLRNRETVFFILREGFTMDEFEKLKEFVNISGTEKLTGRLRLINDKVKSSPNKKTKLN